MPTNAAQTLYRQEYIAGFERGVSLLRKTVTVEGEVHGTSFVFLVADSGSAGAVTRGLNGRIPTRSDSLTQTTATLTEWHDIPEATRYNIYTGQGDRRKIMQMSSMKVMNRKIDDLIIDTLETGTQDTGTAVKADLKLVTYAKTILGNNNVPLDGQITALITPAFHGYLHAVKEFGNADYVNNKPFTNALQTFTWMGINFIVHSGLPGAGTAAEKCFMYHKDAVGHACDIENLKVEVGYDAKQDYSWARTSAFMGTALLQNTGLIIMNHDGSEFAAQ